MSSLGSPRLHLREVGSTNARARELAMAGAVHGTLVTATAQLSGRGRQGRTWVAPPGRSLIASLVLRDPPRLLPLLAGVAVAGLAGGDAELKWPNDVLLSGRKVAGILVEGRPAERWAVLGLGVNVAVRDDDLPEDLRSTATGLGREPHEIEAALAELLNELQRWLDAPEPELLDRVRSLDALRGRRVSWGGGAGVGSGIDSDGRLLVETDAGAVVALDAGEVHLGRSGP